MQRPLMTIGFVHVGSFADDIESCWNFRYLIQAIAEVVFHRYHWYRRTGPCSEYNQ